MEVENMNKELYLNSIAKICMNKLDDLSIPIEHNVAFTVNTRATTRFGQCKYNRKANTYSINIMSELIEPSTVIGLKQTIIHELLHTCPNCLNHGNIWKKYARMVNDATGLNVSRTNSCEELGVNRKAIQNYKYVIICEKCGKKWYRQKASNITKYPERYKCSCGGKLKVERI